jgi:thiamine-phosphate pyrophosphorylase
MIKGVQFILNHPLDAACHSIDVVEQAIQGGVSSVQFRHKGIYTNEAFYLAEQLAALCQKKAVPFIINDRVDIALATGAQGVHLGQEDLPLSVARALLGKKRIIGISTHNLYQAMEAQRNGASYIGFGPIFLTRTKTFDHPPIGLTPLEQICRQISIPVFAIGGITTANLADVCQAGAASVAVVSAISKAKNPCEETQKLIHILNRYSTYE